jgi:hypothetical protein
VNATTYETTWMPQAQVEKVIATAIAGVDLRIEAIAALPRTARRSRACSPVSSSAYTTWLEGQARTTCAEPRRTETCKELLLQRADLARDRIAAGLAAWPAIPTPSSPSPGQPRRRHRDAPARLPRQRQAPRADRSAPRWRPFQLAFILMNLAGIADPTHADREVVDLLFFPTGGGKTEAYLGLAAFTLVLRRLRNPGLAGRRASAC